MNNLKVDDKANVIVCFCEGITVRKLLIAIKHLNLTGRFLIIGSDGWADRQDVVSEYELQAAGSISIRIHSPYIESFDNYYFGLDPFENHRNPWFREFWEDKFHCKMPPERAHAVKATTTTTKATIIESSTIAGDDNVTDFTTTPVAPTTQIPFCTGENKQTSLSITNQPFEPSSGVTW